LVLSQADSSELMANARKLGMRTLRESGALKAVMGITTLEEILRTS
jgi:type II secretory ATPase GspE/PulE/Tfp pilus assembly ATPase PilB-like protein